MDKGIDDCDNAIENILNSMVHSDIINDATKYPSSEVTYQHGQDIDALGKKTEVKTATTIKGCNLSRCGNTVTYSTDGAYNVNNDVIPDGYKPCTGLSALVGAEISADMAIVKVLASGGVQMLDNTSSHAATSALASRFCLTWITNDSYPV